MKNTKEPIFAKRAAALKYDPAKGDAPIVTACGSGFVAERIIEQAAEHNVPVVEDAAVADILSKFSVGDAISPKLYEAVAQILVFVASIDSDYQQKLRNAQNKQG